MTRNDNYYAQRASLFPWHIIRLLPNCQRIAVGQFRNRSDAEGHLAILRRMIPHAQFVIVFELPAIARSQQNTPQ